MAKASTEVHQRILEKVGADRIILPEQEMGRRIAANLISGNIIDYIELSRDYSIVEIGVLPEWVDHTIIQLDIRSKHGLNIIAIAHEGEINISPAPDYVLDKSDKLVVVGSNKSIQELESKRNE